MKVEDFILRVIIYINIATLLLYLISPFYINSGYKILNIAYIALNISMIYFGYKAGVRKIRHRHVLFKKSSVSSFRNTYIFLILFYFATFLLGYAYMLYLPPFDISALISRIMVGVLDPAAGRFFYHGDRTLPWSLYFIISLINSLFFIISFIKWKDHTRFIKILIIFLTIIEFLYWQGTGTSFGSFMLITSVFFSILVNSDKDYLNKRSFVLYTAIGVLSVISILAIFAVNMEGRAGGDFESVNIHNFFYDTPVALNNDHYIYKVLPDGLQALFSYIFSYTTQGYMFLEYIYSLDFHWGFLFGNNPAAQSMAQSFLGFDPEIASYQSQIENTFGVDRNVYWHSCYLWLANDFTILGVPLIIYFISKFCSSALVLYQRTKDLLSGIIFIIFSTVLLFLFANNNYISTVFNSFIFIFPYWFFTKYKYNK